MLRNGRKVSEDASLDPPPAVEVDERRIRSRGVPRLVYVKLRLPVIRGEIRDVGHHTIAAVNVQSLRERICALCVRRRRRNRECRKQCNDESEFSHGGFLRCSMFCTGILARPRGRLNKSWTN